MTDAIVNFKKSIKDYTLSTPEKKPKENYITILILRELKSAARFTTDGLEANSAVIRIGNLEATVGKLFGRKQVASDRRTAKSLQRTLLAANEMGDDWKGCTMSVNEMCQKCPECALFGSAASKEKMSITSRVMYDEAYTIRNLNAVVEDYFQNAPGDDYLKGTSTAIREPDFFKEGTLFPCVVTLRDVTPEEVLFFLNITDRNSRYGATSTRFGKMENHILGVYASHREGPSSLEVAKGIALKLAEKKEPPEDEPYENENNTPVNDKEKLEGNNNKKPENEKTMCPEDKLKKVMNRDTLSVEDVKIFAVEVYKSLSNKHRIEYVEFDGTQTTEILNDLKDDKVVRSILVDQIGKLGDFLKVQGA
jgi:CRISPR-associated protein Csc2